MLVVDQATWLNHLLRKSALLFFQLYTLDGKNHSTMVISFIYEVYHIKNGHVLGYFSSIAYFLQRPFALLFVQPISESPFMFEESPS